MAAHYFVVDYFVSDESFGPTDLSLPYQELLGSMSVPKPASKEDAVQVYNETRAALLH